MPSFVQVRLTERVSGGRNETNILFIVHTVSELEDIFTANKDNTKPFHRTACSCQCCLGYTLEPTDLVKMAIVREIKGAWGVARDFLADVKKVRPKSDLVVALLTPVGVPIADAERELKAMGYSVA